MSWNILYILNLFAILIFAISYYLNCYRKGYRVDFWHLQLFLLCVLPNMLMLPFARNQLNALILGQDFNRVVSAVPIVFLITIAGYLAVLVGGTMWRIRIGVGTRKLMIHMLDFVPRCSRMLMSSSALLAFHFSMCIFLQVAILAVYFGQNGFGFDLRAFTFANPALRPVALIISNYSIVTASHCLARYIDKKERLLLVCTLLLTVGLVFFGARSNLIAIYINIFICYLIRLRKRLSLFRVAGAASILVLVGFYLGNVRAGEYSIGDFFSAFVGLLLYGNNFSDLRDFAWVYADWNQVLWSGKTYLAALFSFVPRAISPFRDTWGLGVATGTTLGLDPQVHPGVRPGAFGESFFNFGIFGVIIVGLMLGIVSRRVDTDVKRFAASKGQYMVNAFAATMLIGIASALAVSSSFSGVYVLIGIYAFSWTLLSIGRMLGRV